MYINHPPIVLILLPKRQFQVFDGVVSDISIIDPGLSDHVAVLFTLSILKPPHHTKTISFRKLKAINKAKFIDDLSVSPIIVNAPAMCDSLTQAYNSSLMGVLDQHAPLRTTTITVRPECKFFNDELLATKRHVCKLEWLKNHSGLTVHRQMFDAAALAYRHDRTRYKKEYFNKCILEAQGNQGALFKITDKLLQNNANVILPKSESNRALANDFATFFDDKVEKIQLSLAIPPHDQLGGNPFHEQPASSVLFSPLTIEQVADLIKNSPVKSSPLDPIPADFFMSCLPTLLPCLTAIINSSLATGFVPTNLKGAHLTSI